MIASLKAATRQILARSYLSSGLPRVWHRGRVAILTYHRIVSDDMVRTGHIQPGMYVRVETFEAHVAYLRKWFVVLALDELLELWRADQLDPQESYCVVTFDDGWQDNYRYAFPVLMKYSLPATIFLATDYIGTSRWFWPDEMMFLLGEAKKRMTSGEKREVLANVIAATPGIGEAAKGKVFARIVFGESIDNDAIVEWCKGLRPEVIHQFVDRLGHAVHVDLPTRQVLLNWDEVREMAGKGVTFGSHSCSHRLLTQISQAEVERELVDSWQAMLLQGVMPVPVFCYPNGNCNQSVKALVRKAGYLGAVGCRAGLEGDHPDDLFDLKRIGLSEPTTASGPLFSLTLSGLR